MTNPDLQQPDPSGLYRKGQELAGKFSNEWDVFTRMVAVHPKTGIIISLVVGFVLGAFFL